MRHVFLAGEARARSHYNVAHIARPLQVYAIEANVLLNGLNDLECVLISDLA